MKTAEKKKEGLTKEEYAKLCREIQRWLRKLPKADITEENKHRFL